MTEEEMRELAGYSPAPEVTFCGEQFKLADDGLAALIRYARTATLEDSEAAAMPAAYRLLQSTITDFSAFEYHALTSKAQYEDITAVLYQVIEHYCARSHWAGMRLIGVVAGSMAEIDGQVLRAGGRGLAGLSAREACNLALAICLDGRSEEDRDIFLEDLEYEGNPEAEALAALRKFQAEKKAAEQAAGNGEP